MFKRLKGFFEEEEKEVPLAALDPWVEEEISAAKKRIVEEGAPLVEHIRAGFEDLDLEVEEIRNVEKELFRRLSNITKTSQKKFCESISNVIKRMSFERKDYDGILEIHRIALESLATIKRMDEIHGKVLYFSFEKEMKGFRTSVKTIALHTAALENAIDAKRGRLESLFKLKEKLSEIENNGKRLSQIEYEASALHAALENEESRMEKLSRLRLDLMESEAYEEFERERRRREELEGEGRKIEEEIHGRLAPLLRIFRKALSESRHGRMKVNEDLLVAYGESPLETFLSEEPGYPKLRVLLSDILSFLESIEEKDKKKIASAMNFILKGGLEEPQKKRISMIREIEMEEEKNPEILSKIEEAEKTYEECARKKEGMTQVAEALNLESSQLKERNAILTKGLHEDAGRLGIRIAVEDSSW